MADVPLWLDVTVEGASYSPDEQYRILEGGARRCVG
jgi:hypothetical protein